MTNPVSEYGVGQRLICFIFDSFEDGDLGGFIGEGDNEFVVAIQDESCQKLDVRSMVVKMVELARPMSLIHSLTSFMEYLSVWVFSLSPLKYCTMRRPPLLS